VLLYDSLRSRQGDEGAACEKPCSVLVSGYKGRRRVAARGGKQLRLAVRKQLSYSKTAQPVLHENRQGHINSTLPQSLTHGPPAPTARFRFAGMSHLTPVLGGRLWHAERSTSGYGVKRGVTSVVRAAFIELYQRIRSEHNVVRMSEIQSRHGLNTKN